MRRVRLVVLLLLSANALAQDVLTVGSGIAAGGGTISIPISIRDRSGTPLGIDAGGANRIQGFAFKILFPSERITSAAFTRAGVTASITPLDETALQGSGWSACLVSFHESSNPVPFTLDAAAPGDAIGTLTVTVHASAPAGSTIALILDPPSATLSNRSGSPRETVANGNLSLVNGSITVSTLPTPAGLVATSPNTAEVNVDWNDVAGADHYEIWRSSHGDAFASIATRAGSSFLDMTADAGTTYLYRVRAIDGAGGTSAFSNVDAATVIAFTDPTLIAFSTRVKLVHVTELRTAVNAMRDAAGLSPLAADGTIAAGALVRATHIANLRTALDEARSIIGLSTLTSTNPTLAAGTTAIRAVHVQELRNGVM
jgi:hypothetical protein